jgi:hypothetical protein
MSKWISVKDRLPEVDPGNLCRSHSGYLGHPFFPVLFHNKIDGVCAGRFFAAQRKGGVWPPHAKRFISLQGERYAVKDVTHWMPLPDPPE